MARNNNRSRNARNARTESGPITAERIDSSSKQNNVASETIRNLATILGITILLVMSVILVAFFVAGNNKPNTSPATTVTGTGNTTDQSTTAVVAGTQDQITGSLAGGTQDTKPATTDQTPTQTTDTSPTQPVAAEPPQSYSFTAGQGDSLSWLARRAMYAYMGDRNLGLDRGQRLFFEVQLTQSSGSNGLSVGEVTTFSATTMDNIMYQATHLSASQLASWNNLAQSSGYQ